MKTTIAFCSFLALLSCNVSVDKKVSSDVSIDEAKSKEVFEHHMRTFGENDLEGIMADYTDESILMTPDATYKGLAEIRKGFEGVFKLFPKDSSTMEMIKTEIKDDLVYIIWKGKGPKLELTFATDSFIIQNGKIIRQTFAGH